MSRDLTEVRAVQVSRGRGTARTKAEGKSVCVTSSKHSRANVAGVVPARGEEKMQSGLLQGPLLCRVWQGAIPNILQVRKLGLQEVFPSPHS